MNMFTYENENRTYPLELYEWDNIWFEHLGENGKERVLYIGDSISCGVRKYMSMYARKGLLFDGFGTSKAVDNPFLPDMIRLIAAQQQQRRVVLFNSGLHGWHLQDAQEYGLYYEKMIQFLLSEFEGASLFLLLTTSVQDSERERRVIARNEAVKKLAKKYELPVVDLYSASVQAVSLRESDGVHYSEEGYKQFAKCVVSVIGLYN